MRKALKAIWDHYEEIIQIILFAAIIIVVTAQIVSRVVFKNPFMFTEELARFIYIWMVYLGIPWVFKNGTNLCLDLSPSWMVHRNKARFMIFVHIVNIAMSVFLIVVSIQYIEFAWINPAPALRISMGIVYLVMPITMTLSIARSIEMIVQHIKRLKAGDNFNEYIRLIDKAHEAEKKGDMV